MSIFNTSFAQKNDYKEETSTRQKSQELCFKMFNMFKILS